MKDQTNTHKKYVGILSQINQIYKLLEGEGKKLSIFYVKRKLMLSIKKNLGLISNTYKSPNHSRNCTYQHKTMPKKQTQSIISSLKQLDDHKLQTCAQVLTLEDERKAGESRNSAGLRPDGIAKYEEGDTGGGEMGSDGGRADLNLGKLEYVWSEKPRVIAFNDRATACSLWNE